MLSVSLGCPFLVTPCVACTQCCQCLYVVHSWLPSCVACTQCFQCLCVVHSWLPLMLRVPNVTSVSGLSILGYPLCCVCPMLPVSLGCPFLATPCVACAQCCQYLWVVNSWLPPVWRVPNVASVSGLSILGYPFCGVCRMLPVSLGCPFLVTPCVACAQCCQCLWVVHSWLPPVWRVPNVASISGLSILGYPLCGVCPMLPVSLGCPFLVTPFVACAECCQCLWVVHSWLPPLWRVPNVASVSGLSILGYPLCGVCPMLPMSLGCPFLATLCVACAQCCQYLWVVHSWLPPVWRVPNVANVSGLSILGYPLCGVCPMLPVSLGCPFLVTPCAACAQCCQCLWVVHSWLPPLWRVPNVASVSGLSILGYPLCGVCRMLPVSLGCPFLVTPCVACAQCCQCLWVVHSWLPSVWRAPNVASISGLSILGYPLCGVCPMLPVSPGCPFLVTPSVFSNVYFILIARKNNY